MSSGSSRLLRRCCRDCGNHAAGCLFISSVNGRIATPMLGPYSASKFALEAACDALRVELKAWGIPVVLIEPAQTDTDMWRTAGDMVLQIEADMSPEHRDLYARHIAGNEEVRPDGPQDGLAHEQGCRASWRRR